MSEDNPGTEMTVADTSSPDRQSPGRKISLDPDQPHSPISDSETSASHQSSDHRWPQSQSTDQTTPNEIDALEDYRETFDNYVDEHSGSIESSTEASISDSKPSPSQVPDRFGSETFEFGGNTPHLSRDQDAISSYTMGSVSSGSRRALHQSVAEWQQSPTYYSPRNRPSIRPSIKRDPIRRISGGQIKPEEGMVIPQIRRLSSSHSGTTVYPIWRGAEPDDSAPMPTLEDIESTEAEMEERIRLEAEEKLSLAKRLRDAEAYNQRLLKEMEIDKQNLDSELDDMRRELALRKKDLVEAKKCEKSLREAVLRSDREIQELHELQAPTQDATKKLERQREEHKQVLSHFRKTLSKQDETLRRLQEQLQTYEQCNLELRREEHISLNQLHQLEQALIEAKAKNEHLTDLSEANALLASQNNTLQQELDLSKAEMIAQVKTDSQNDRLKLDDGLNDIISANTKTQQISTIGKDQLLIVNSLDAQTERDESVQELLGKVDQGPPTGHISFSRFMPLMILVLYAVWQMLPMSSQTFGVDQLYGRHQYYGSDRHPRWLQSLWYVLDTHLGCLNDV